MDPRWAQVDEAQLMSTEELPPENEALEPSGSESADLAGKVDHNRLGSASAETSFNCVSTPTTSGPLGMGQQNACNTPFSTPQTQATSQSPRGCRGLGSNTSQSSTVAPAQPVRIPNVLMALDRKVRVSPDEDPSCYTLCRRWMQNDPEGFANPIVVGMLLKQSSVLSVAIHRNDSGVATPQAAPHFWEMAPILLPPLPSPCAKDARPEEEAPRIKPAFKNASLESMRQEHFRHWKAVRSHFKRKSLAKTAPYKQRLACLMMEAKKIKSSMDAFDRAREEAEAKTRQRAEEQARKEEEDRRLAQEKQALTSGAGALPLGTIGVVSPAALPALPHSQQATPARAPPQLGTFRSPRGVSSKPPIHPGTPIAVRPPSADPQTPIIDRSVLPTVSTPLPQHALLHAVPFVGAQHPLPQRLLAVETPPQKPQSLPTNGRIPQSPVGYPELVPAQQT